MGRRPRRELEFSGREETITLNVCDVLDQVDIAEALEYYSEEEILNNIDIDNAIKYYSKETILESIDVYDIIKQKGETEICKAIDPGSYLDEVGNIEILDAIGISDVVEHFTIPEILNEMGMEAFLSEMNSECVTSYVLEQIDCDVLYKLLNRIFDYPTLLQLFIRAIKEKEKNYVKKAI